MIYAYTRNSKDEIDVNNQRFEILKFCDERRIQVDTWITEEASRGVDYQARELGGMIDKLEPTDTLIAADISRLAGNTFELMHMLHRLMQLQVVVLTCKERYELKDDPASAALAFAFGLGSQMERVYLKRRTKEALARKKADGVVLGRPVGSKSKETKLSGKEEDIRGLLSKKVAVSAIARIYGVNRQTVSDFIESRDLIN